MTIADARSIMFTIHRERRRLQPWATKQNIEQRLERIIANDKAVVEHELALIARATELDGMGVECIDRLQDFSERVREILEGE